MLSSHSSITTTQANFSLNLLRNVEFQNSTILSPISILIALGMALLGAKENTAQEIRNAIGKGMELDEIHQHYLDILNMAESNSKQDICQRMELDKTHENFYSDLLNLQKSNCSNSLLFANKIYFSEGIQILDSFQSNMKKFYNGSFQLLDFTDAQKAVEIPMLELSKRWQYFENELFQFLEIPFKGKEFSMFILLPRERHGLSSVIETLSAEEMLEAVSSAASKYGKVIIPEFTVSASFDLKEFLPNLLITDAFDEEKADFSGTTTSTPIFISNIVHKSQIQVNKFGTKAVAVTRYHFEWNSGAGWRRNEERFHFFADHPFLYFIADKNKNIYFIGTFYG